MKLLNKLTNKNSQKDNICTLKDMNISDKTLNLQMKLLKLPSKENLNRWKKYSYIEIKQMDNSNLIKVELDTIEIVKSYMRRHVIITTEVPLKLLPLSDIRRIIKWSFHLVVKEDQTEKRYRVRLNEEKEFSLNDQFTFEKNMIYQPYKTIKGNLSIKHYHSSLINEIELFSNHKNIVTLEGTLIPDFLNVIKQYEKKGITLKKRGTDFSIDLPIEINTKQSWSLDICLEDIPALDGIIDFYFFVERAGNKALFRMKVGRTTKHIVKTVFQNHGEPFLYSTFTTKKGSLSLKINPLVARLKSLHMSPMCNTKCKITGLLDIPVPLEGQCFLKFYESDTETELSYVMEFENAERYKVKFSLFMDLMELNHKKYDVYFYKEDKGNTILFKVKTDLKTMKTSTMRELTKEDKLYQTYFSLTEDQDLLFVVREAGLYRDIKELSLSENYLNINGVGYIQRPKSVFYKPQHITLLLMNRLTGENCKIEAESYPGSVGGDNKSFTVNIPTTKLIKLTNRVKDILDVYIQIQVGKHKKIRKLGFKTFEYFKDDFLYATKIERDGKIISLYLCLTPKGNIRVETITQQGKQVISNQKPRILKEGGTKKELWIIGERPDTAQENGYHFFKYCREQYPDMEVYYAILPGSKDEENIRHFGNVLYIGSEDHVEKCIDATAFFSSHDIDYLLPFKGSEIEGYKSVLQVFLQHGVLGRKKVEYYKNQYKNPFNMVCASSTNEKELLINEFGYNEKEVKVTGLPRYDELHSKVELKNNILLIPTWREWLTSQSTFNESEYLMRYESLMNNPDLHELLTKHDLELTFYPHYRMQQYFRSADLTTHPKVKIVSFGDARVQDLIKTSKLMITDYSSVSYDFNYMNKPVIFYHFDKERFFKNGILRPEEETFFGDIVSNEKDLIDTLTGYVETYLAEKQFTQQIFDFQDESNCKRIFDEAIEMRRKLM
ncbi:CDP-glycerol glycerophosphotransferase family protein [Alteribacter populi]|uniref:CDP-glycerol glycerophosphotransferase family protein n=1 Tax=Alteribacter populi TaxID=2011011 RepID=UPI000BBA455F|nr:CDP-glycerol glycerophosphotransferase family protein [Alteribacter populi]